MAIPEKLRDLFLKLSEPRTLEEIIADFSGTATPSIIDDVVWKMVSSGEIEAKQLCAECTVFCAPSKTTRKRSSNARSVLRQRATLAFKSPAKLGPTSGSSQQSCQNRKTSPDTINLEAVARDVLKLKNQLEAAQREIRDLSEDYHEDELQAHIDKLHEYNEVKDMGQILLGKIAEVEGTTTAAVYERFGLDFAD